MAGGKAPREKGRRFERATVQDLARFDPDVSIQYDQPFKGGCDIAFSPQGFMNDPIWIECKVGVKPDWRKASRQASDTAPVNWAVRSRDDRQEPIWILPDHLMLKILERLK